MGHVRQTLTDTIAQVNRLQDDIVDRYFVPYSVRLTYWAFGLLFVYIGIQKVLPHRTAADEQLALVGGLVGLPYISFVAFIGLWQIAIGSAFLLRRLRVAGLLFFSFQFFAFGSLVVLRQVVFQPPYIPVLGVDIPWALGMYAAFVMKNLVFAGVLFVLASQELDRPMPTPGGSSE